ncbi:MAG: copper chaperone PCu(A)C [Ilumatobacteraceae bacterium]
MNRSIALVAIVPMTLLGCGGSDDAGVSVSDAWARATVAGTTVGAVYFDLVVSGDDTLVSVSVPADVAAGAELHEVVPTEVSGASASGEYGAMNSDEMDMGAVQMRELTDGLPLTGGDRVSFEPGGAHVMLPGLVAPLESGDEFDMTFEFRSAPAVTVTVDVAEDAP